MEKTSRYIVELSQEEMFLVESSIAEINDRLGPSSTGQGIFDSEKYRNILTHDLHARRILVIGSAAFYHPVCAFPLDNNGNKAHVYVYEAQESVSVNRNEKENS